MRKIKKNTIYRHFKGDLALVLDIVYDSETKKEMVLYKELHGDCKSWVRPVEMFLSEVDHKKYPNVKQKYRFKEVKLESKVQR